MPRGAWPGSCWPLYEVDYPAVEDYLRPGDAALAGPSARGTRSRSVAGDDLASGRPSPTSSPTWRASSARTRSPSAASIPPCRCWPACWPSAPTTSTSPTSTSPAAWIRSRRTCRCPAPIRCWPRTRRRSSPTRTSTTCARAAAWTCAFLGAAQIDGEGCANNSVIGDWHNPKVRLPGGGGGAVMLPTAQARVHVADRAFAPHAGREARLPDVAGRLPRRGHAHRRVLEARRATRAAVVASRNRASTRCASAPASSSTRAEPGRPRCRRHVSGPRSSNSIRTTSSSRMRTCGCAEHRYARSVAGSFVTSQMP